MAADIVGADCGGWIKLVPTLRAHEHQCYEGKSQILQTFLSNFALRIHDRRSVQI